jgi:hypothetical protein
MKGKLLALMLLAGGTMFAGSRVFFGVGIGVAAPPPVAYYAPPPVAYYAPPPPPVAAYIPPYPGPGYSWVTGYWYPVGPRWVWRAGFWTRPPYGRGTWIAPRYTGRQFFGGYWRR